MLGLIYGISKFKPLNNKRIAYNSKNIFLYLIKVLKNEVVILLLIYRTRNIAGRVPIPNTNIKIVPLNRLPNANDIPVAR